MSKFILGDCKDILKDMSNNSVDLIITSPPYNINLKYNSYKDNKKREEYLQWIYDIFVELKRVLKDDGHIFLNMGYTNKDPYISMEVALKLKDLFILQNNITWIKATDTEGHFKPINSKRYLNLTNENIYHFTKTGDIPVNKKIVPYKDKSNLVCRRTGRIKEDGRCKGNSWYIPYAQKNKKGMHPAIFPDELVEMCIKISNIKSGVIMDCFCGSGTTIRVGEKYNLSGIGIDTDELYIDYCLTSILPK